MAGDVMFGSPQFGREDLIPGSPLSTTNSVPHSARFPAIPERRGAGGFLPGVHPNSRNSLESPFGKVGLRGLKSAGGFRSALSALQLDSRFRGNDKRECRDASLPAVWGCSPVPYSPPKTIHTARFSS